MSQRGFSISKGVDTTDLLAAKKLKIAAADFCVYIAAVSFFCYACEEGGGEDYIEEGRELHSGIKGGG